MDRKNGNKNCLNELNELKFCEVSRNSFSNRCWKFQLSILKNKKVLFQKKYFLGRCQYQNKKAFFTDPIFSEGLVLTTTISGGKIDIIGEKTGGKQETETFVDYFSENLLISVVLHNINIIHICILFWQFFFLNL